MRNSVCGRPLFGATGLWQRCSNRTEYRRAAEGEWCRPLFGATGLWQRGSHRKEYRRAAEGEWCRPLFGSTGLWQRDSHRTVATLHPPDRVPPRGWGLVSFCDIAAMSVFCISLYILSSYIQFCSNSRACFEEIFHILPIGFKAYPSQWISGHSFAVWKHVQRLISSAVKICKRMQEPRREGGEHWHLTVHELA
jgi:hypothetical protein